MLANLITFGKIAYSIIRKMAESQKFDTLEVFCYCFVIFACDQWPGDLDQGQKEMYALWKDLYIWETYPLVADIA